MKPSKLETSLTWVAVGAVVDYGLYITIQFLKL